MRKPLTTCLLSLAAGSLLVLPGAAHATVLACGDQLTQDTTLTADLHCGEGAPTVPRPDGTDSYASILIAADDVTLDLNGHEISSYTGDAIVAYGRRNIIIRNGTAWGISLDDTTDSHIHDIDTAGSFGSGIGLSGSHRNRIERNRVRGEAGIGLYNSSDNLVADNDIGAPAGALSSQTPTETGSCTTACVAGWAARSAPQTPTTTCSRQTWFRPNCPASPARCTATVSAAMALTSGPTPAATS